MEIIQDDLYEQFTRVATLHPEKTSLVNENGEDISYEMLARKVNMLYNHLNERQVQAGQFVAIYLERDVNMIASILALLACRAPFLLLDNSIPKNRLKGILVDTMPVAIVTNDYLQPNLQPIIKSEQIIQVNNVFNGKPENMIYNRTRFQPNDPLYIMYTSGSTGTPKGVIIPHQAIWNRFQWMWKVYPWAIHDRQLWKTSITFGDSIWEMLGGLLQGVPTVITSNTITNDPISISHLIHQQRVTRLTVVPTMLLAILKAFPDHMTIQQQLGSLKIVVASGEVLTKSTCALFCKYLPNVTLLNLYGSTEMANDVTYHEISNSLDYHQYESIPIGKPIENIDYLLLDSQGNPSTKIGQLLITGAGLFTAYLNLPQQTASSQVILDGKTYYKTGDLVRVCQNTEQLIFLSRIDNQVKIRGCRVELEEIESVLVQHSAVIAGGCFITKDITERLIALFTANRPIDQAELVDWMSSNLPTYATPSSYVCIEAIPRTSSGKLDRAQLPALYAQYQLRINNEVPTERNNLYSFIFPIWCRVLNIENIHDASQKTFTQLGGHSLLAIQIQRQLYAHFFIHVPINRFFTNLTVLDLCKLVDDCRMNQSINSCKPSPVILINDTKIIPVAVPLTASQQGIWIDDELSSDANAKYNIEATYEIADDKITSKFLIEALQFLVERHHSLRTVFERNEYGDIVQIVKSISGDSVNDTRILISHDFTNEQSIDFELTRFLSQKFELNQSKPCFVCHIINVADRPRVLCMIFHHIIIDGWSIAVLVRELNQILQAFIDKIDPNQCLNPVQCQFHQYATHLNSKTWDKDVAYWKEKLSNGVMNFACLPSDHENYSDIVGASFFREISSTLVHQIQTTCQSIDVTPFMILLATFDVLLGRWTTCWEDIVVATPVFNRPYTEIENTVGLFVNLLLMRIDLSADPTFYELMIDVKRTILEAFEHQEAPFTYVTSKLERLDRGSHIPQLFQVLFAYQNVGEIVSTNLLRKIQVENSTAKCDLEVHVWENAQGALTVHAQYRKSILKAPTVERLIDQWFSLTEAALNKPTTHMSEWLMTSDDEKMRLINTFSQLSDTNKQQPLDKTLCQLFHEQVTINGNANALEHDGNVQTYAQLWSICVNVAWKIRHLLTAIRSDEKICIAIMTFRSIQTVQSMLSVLLAGYYYVNIDPDLPMERVKWILRETGAALLITDDLENVTNENPTIFGIPIATFSSLLNQIEKLDASSIQYPAAKYSIKPEDLAYVIFTSGSTGTPKGVSTTHKNIVCRTVGVDCHSIRPGYRVGQMCSLSFDVSTFEIYATLLNGGILVIVNNSAIASCSALASLNLDMINPPTAVFNILAKQSDAAVLFPTLDTVIFAGEKANAKCVRAVRQYAPKILINGYGPTETTHNALCYTITEGSSMYHSIPIGRPLPNTYVYVVDSHLKLVPIGVSGELLIGGAGVSVGYFNDVTLTRQKFISNPIVSTASLNNCDILYRTGDIVRMLEDGNIEYLHRIDNQVKIRSQRIELGEIESRLLDLQEISEVVVVLRDDIFEENNDDQQHLVAYVVLIRTLSITESQIRHHLTQWLPHHMIPSFIVILEKMPLSSIGKINRRMLPKPVVMKSVKSVVLDILASVLKKENLPGSASFLQLGGHSLSAMEVMARLHQTFGITTSVRQLFQSPTLNNYADQIELAVTSQLQPSTTPTSNNLLVASSTVYQRLELLPAQRQFWFLWKMKTNNPCYNVPIALNIDGYLDHTILCSSLQLLMEQHELLRTLYEEGCDGSIWQRVQKEWILPFTVVDLTESSQLTERLRFYITQPFDLKLGPVCRFVLLHARDRPHRYIFLMVFHHITCDGHSLEYFLDQLAQLYSTRGQRKTSLSSSSSLLKFIHEQTAINKTLQLKQMDTIIKHLADFKKLPLISDTVDNEQITTQIELGHPAYVAYVEFTSTLGDKLRQLSTTHNCTLFTLLLTLYKCVLSVFSYDCLDVLVGSVLSTRKYQNAPKDLFAPLINTLVLRTIIPENDDAILSDIIDRVKETVLLAMENQTCSFSDIVTHLRSINTPLNERHQPFLPLFRVLFEMNSYRLIDRQHQFGDDTIWTMYTDLNMIFPFTKSDIDLHAVENGPSSSIHVSFRANTRLLEPATIEKLAQCYLGAAELIVREPYCTKLTLWTELHIMESGLLIHECFLYYVRRNPTRICLIQDHSSWSFQQLYDQIKSVAIALQKNFNVQPGTIIALCMHRSAHLIVAMFGVLMTGAAYVYLDPTLPFQRILAMIKLTSSTLVLSDNDSHQFLNDKHNEMVNISLINELYQMGSSDLSYKYVLVKPTDPCYVIFTSGTTGKPKGIRIQHQAVVRRTHMHDYLRIDSSSRVAHVNCCSFDGYILEVYAALLNGASVIVYNTAQVMDPKSLSHLFKRDGITHAYLPTPIFNTMAEYVPNAFSGMISVMSAGDRANAKLMRRVLLESQPPPEQLINAYGPTETTCISTWYYVTLQALDKCIEHGLPIPIGTALPDTPLYIVQPNTLELTDDGELLIGGFGVSPGYLNLPEETAAKFLQTNPFSTTDQRHIYRSGDHVRRLSDGNLQFIGRFDKQVKVDGCRIELAEIENHIKYFTNILDAVVTLRNDIIPNTETIVAYIKPMNVSPYEIKQYLIHRLPRYMVPVFIVPVASFPIIGGKIDHSRLPKPTMNSLSYSNETSTIPPEKSTMEKLQDAWQHVLGHDRLFKDTDDFFLSGGKSFTVVHLHSMLETLFQIELDIVQLFVHTTFSQQLQWLNSIIATKQENQNVASISAHSSICCSHRSVTYDNSDKIAIIGISARYGTVETVEDLWAELCKGSDLCTRVSHDELRKQEHLVEMLKFYPNYVQARCMMANGNCFDHVFFNMTKRDADITDPQHRILLEASYEALEDAGLVPEDYEGTIGVFGSVLPNTYAEVNKLFNPSNTPDEMIASAKNEHLDPASLMRIEIGNMTDGAPTFVAYKLGLTGPAMALQTACSSSGTALHVALRSIEAGDCDVALVAGASISYPLEAGYIYQPGMVMSKTGFCRSFDERADGVVGGDGVGVIVLMKSKEAIRSGYSVRAIITGHAINNDGYKKHSFAITNSDMQAACMSRALRAAHIENAIEEVRFVEAHGSGTSLGDLLEVQALAKAYGDESSSTSKIYLGSIKTNIGHAAHAGTVASIIKATLTVETGIIPPTIHFQKFSPLIAHLNHPFIVNSTCINWSQSPRRAGINTLGQGGTNSHFILEQFVSSNTDTLTKYIPSQQIFVFSAKDFNSLCKIKQKLVARLPKIKADQHDNVAYTLACGRKAYDIRDFIVATSLDQLHEKLTIPQPIIKACNTIMNIVFLLPGQGAQFAGMAKDLHRYYPLCSKIIEECLNYIEDPIVKQIVENCLFTTEKSNSYASNVQFYAQLSLFIVEYALANLFISLNIKPKYMIGHSSGEIVAACLANVFTAEDAIKLLEHRCKLMTSSCVPHGSMLAVQIYGDAEHLRDEFQVEISAINSNSQYVFSGTCENIKHMEKQLHLREPSRQLKQLHTANAFHSSFMHSLCDQLKEHMSHIRMHEPTIPIISTVTGMMIQEHQMTTIDYWINHLKQPVLFGPAIEHLLSNNDNSIIFIQVGPGKNLLSLVQNIESNAKTALPCLLENEQLNPFLNCIGYLWSQNAVKTLQWPVLFNSSHYQRISLPTYPFKRIICVANNHSQPTELEILTKNDCKSICSAPVHVTSSSISKTILSQSTSGKAPWIVRKSKKINTDGYSVKIIELNTETTHDPTIDASCHSFQLGFYTSIFTRAIYFDLIHDGIIGADTLIVDLLPENMSLDLPAHVNRLTLQQLADGSSELLPSQCNSVEDLLQALVSCAANPNSNSGAADVFAISLLGHSLAAVTEMSYFELINNKIIRPLNLSSTRFIGNEAYAPAVGLCSTVNDIEHLLRLVYGRTTVSKLYILNAIEKSFKDYCVPLVGTEQIVPILCLDTAQALIITSKNNLSVSKLDIIVQKTFGTPTNRTASKITLSDYRSMIISCLQQLTGSNIDTLSLNTTFEQLGIDSLQAITLVDLLSCRLNSELPVDIVYKYPTIATLSVELQQLAKMNNSTSISTPTSYILNIDAGMPKVYQSVGDRSLSTLLQFITRTKSQLLNELTRCGALLFRNFDIFTADEFAQVAKALATTSKSFLDYRDGISKRTHVNNNVFTSTEYPKHVDMTLHNEMSYAAEMPSQILFFCEIQPASDCGGETPIGDSREIYRSIDPTIRSMFINRKLRFIHNMPNHGQGLGKSWQDTYQTNSASEVESFLRARNIEFSWLPDGGLRTIRLVEAVKKHPLTGDWLWCNHAPLFHPSDLPSENRRALESRLAPMDMPKNCFFADNGEVIPDDYLTHIRQVLKTHEIKWAWQRGDVLLLDNYRTAHGRAAFSGDRRILVAMC